MTPDASDWEPGDLRIVAGYHRGLRQEFTDPAEAFACMESAAGLGWTAELRHLGGLVSTWLADIDGTLALRGERGPYDWARVGEDAPNAPVVELVRALTGVGHSIVLLSGRMEQCRRQTVLWLDANVSPAAARFELHMRPDDDYRPDDMLKREIYEKEIAPRYEVTGVIDDRARVVAMWRSLGLTCVQVAPGEF